MRSKMLVAGLKRELRAIEQALEIKTAKKKRSANHRKSKNAPMGQAPSVSSEHVRRKSGLG